MSKTPVADGWARIAKVVIPKDAPEFYRREMRRSYYSGAADVLNIVGRIKKDDEASGDVAVEEMAAAMAEVKQFLLDLIARKV